MNLEKIIYIHIYIYIHTYIYTYINRIYKIYEIINKKYDYRLTAFQ